MTDPRVQIVADGYDLIGVTFDDWRDRIVGDPRAVWRGDTRREPLPGGEYAPLHSCEGETA